MFKKKRVKQKTSNICDCKLEKKKLIRIKLKMLEEARTNYK